MVKQFKMWLDESLIKALDTAAKNHERRSAQEVAEAVLRDYLPFWEQKEQYARNKYEEQREQAQKDLEAIWAEKAHPIKQPKTAQKTKPRRR